MGEAPDFRQKPSATEIERRIDVKGDRILGDTHSDAMNAVIPEVFPRNFLLRRYKVLRVGHDKAILLHRFKRDQSGVHP